MIKYIMTYKLSMLSPHMKGYKTVTITDDTYNRLTEFAKRFKVSRGKVVDYAIANLPVDDRAEKMQMMEEINKHLSKINFPKDFKVSDLDVAEAYSDFEF